MEHFNSILHLVENQTSRFAALECPGITFISVLGMGRRSFIALPPGEVAMTLFWLPFSAGDREGDPHFYVLEGIGQALEQGMKTCLPEWDEDRRGIRGTFPVIEGSPAAGAM